MKKVASIDAVRRLALATGAKAEIGGEVFNAAQMRVDLPTAPPQPTPKPVASVAPPVPASPAHVTRAELEQLIADRDTFWMGEMRRLSAMVVQAMAKEPKDPGTWTFTPIYGYGDRLERIEAKSSPNA